MKASMVPLAYALWFSVLVLPGGCEKSSPSTPAAGNTPPTAQGSPGEAGRTTPEIKAQSQPAWPTIRNYVLEPDIDPEELTLADPEVRRNNHLPTRIVCLAPNLTETVYALGLGGLMIGRDSFSIFPPGVERLTDCGGLVDRSVERIVQLAPDLVLTVKCDARLAEKITAHNIRTLALPDDALKEIYAGIRQVGAILGRPKTAERLVGHLQHDLEQISAQARNTIPSGLRVAYVSEGFMPPPSQTYFAGQKSCIGEFLVMIGATPAVGAAETPYVPMSLEQIIGVNPQVIVEMRLGQEITPQLREKALAAWGTVGQIDAVRDKRIVLLTHPALLVPGPRVNLALLELAKGLTAVWSR